MLLPEHCFKPQTRQLADSHSARKKTSQPDSSSEFFGEAAAKVLTSQYLNFFYCIFSVKFIGSPDSRQNAKIRGRSFSPETSLLRTIIPRYITCNFIYTSYCTQSSGKTLLMHPTAT